MNDFINILQSATKDFDKLKKQLDETVDSISNDSNPEVATAGKTLKSGMKDAFEKRDLTKLQKLLSNGYNN